MNKKKEEAFLKLYRNLKGPNTYKSQLEFGDDMYDFFIELKKIFPNIKDYYNGFGEEKETVEYLKRRIENHYQIAAGNIYLRDMVKNTIVDINGYDKFMLEELLKSNPTFEKIYEKENSSLVKLRKLFEYNIRDLKGELSDMAQGVGQGGESWLRGYHCTQKESNELVKKVWETMEDFIINDVLKVRVGSWSVRLKGLNPYVLHQWKKNRNDFR